MFTTVQWWFFLCLIYLLFVASYAMPGRPIQLKLRKHDMYNEKKRKQDYTPTMKDCNYHFKWETIEVILRKGIFATMGTQVAWNGNFQWNFQVKQNKTLWFSLQV